MTSGPRSLLSSIPHAPLLDRGKMAAMSVAPSPSTPASRAAAPRIVLADRGDALVSHLSRAMHERFRVVAQIDTEITQAERLLVAATTFRPGRREWVERFYKSNLAVSMRSRRAARALDDVDAPFDVVFQTHALFELTDPRSVLYIDCTHRQSADQWPEWNPLRGAGLERWYVRERRQYHSAAHLFAFSVETRDSLVEQYHVPADRVTVVGAGLNFDVMPEVDLERRRVAAPTVLFIGNDFERKGGLQLLRAFRFVREQVPTARLVVVGTPHPIPPQDGVEVIGRVEGRSAMSRLYEEASVFCLPSFFDPFPLVLMEAMAHRLPCVATSTCGVLEIVLDGETGVMVPRDDAMVTSIAATLTELLLDPARAAHLGDAGRQRVEERFLWSHVIDRMTPILAAMTPQRR